MTDDVPVPPEVIAMIKTIGVNAFAIWVFMRSYADADGKVDVSYGAISAELGITAPATISAAIKMLLSHGLLQRKKNFSAAATYYISIPSKIKGMKANTINLINRLTVNPSKNEGMKEWTVSPSNNEGLDNFQRMTDAQQAEQLYQQATGMIAIPSRRRAEDVNTIGRLLREYGAEETLRRMKRAYQNWIIRRGKDGRMYSKLNTGWLDWAMVDEIPGLDDEPIDPMADVRAAYPTYRAGEA